MNSVEVDIDTWPRIPTYLEIEGKSEEEVYHTLELLGIPKEKATSLDVQSIYKKIYGIDLKKEPNLSFDEDNKNIKIIKNPPLKEVDFLKGL